MSAAAEGAAGAAAKGAASCCSCLWKALKSFCRVFSDCVKRLPVRVVSIMLRVINIINAILLGACCYFGYEASNGSPMRFFLTTYIGLFALLLFLFETRVPWTAPFIRRMFGFMFSYAGRAIFLVFIGCICFGMIDSSLQKYSAYDWCYAMGFVTLANAAFNAFILCSHPGFRKGGEGHADGVTAAAGSVADPAKMTPDQLAAYLKAHPEIVAAAAAAAAGGGATAVAVASEADPQELPGEGAPSWARPRPGEDDAAGASAAAAPAPKKGGFGALFSGWGGGGGGSSSSGASKPAPTAPVDDGGYKPPVVAAAPPSAPKATPSVAGAPFDAAVSDNPFGFGAGSPAKTASAPPAAAAPPPAAPPRPVIGDDGDDDNPFATGGM